MPFFLSYERNPKTEPRGKETGRNGQKKRPAKSRPQEKKITEEARRDRPAPPLFELQKKGKTAARSAKKA